MQDELDALLSERAEAAPAASFSVFRLEDVQRAYELTVAWMGLAAPEEVLKAAEAAMHDHSADLVRFALISYLTHHPHVSGLRVPPLATRFPYKVVPSIGPATLGAAPQSQAVFANPEARLAWWREDPGLNEHYEHWNAVYNVGGVPGGERKDRHGELFLYLHRQMLARYETERRALGVEAVKSWWPYTVATDPWGYEPGSGLAGRYQARGPNEKWQDAVAISERRQRLLDQIEQGRFADAGALGDALESWRNDGLALFSAMGAPTELPGVMDDSATAARDHLFWRWHKGVDDLYGAWQAKQAPHDFSDGPAVVMRKQIVEPFAAPTPSGSVANRSPDIILSRLDQIPEDWRAHLQEFGDAVFGGEHWDEDFASTSYTTTELQTTMTGGALGHDDFAYFLRVDNQGADPAGITVRVFLAAQDAAEDRRMWIEMDKFRWSLKRSERAVICRPSWLSSVIRKAGTPADGDPDYCDCGWPADLLLPRGRPEAMRFRLLVMLTDWSVDRVAPDSACGSLSYCGARDRYPDGRPMGYPFDRPLPDDRTIAQLVASRPNMATRDVTIRSTPAGGGGVTTPG